MRMRIYACITIVSIIMLFILRGKSTVKFSKNQFFVYWLKKYFEPSKISYIRCYSRQNFSSLKFRPFTEALRNAYLRQIPICLAGTA